MYVSKHNVNAISSYQDNVSGTEVIKRIAMKFLLATVALVAVIFNLELLFYPITYI